MKYFHIYCSKFCNLFIAEENNAICNIFFKPDKIPNDYEKKETALIIKASKQLDEYFNKKLKTFDLPLIKHGTDFQITIWEALQTIPYGETCNYKQIAVKVKNPNACRAVGMANNRNPIPIIIPCHRVIGSDGSLTGYAGGLELKRKLLNLEQN